jgi:hypothetical protein
MVRTWASTFSLSLSLLVDGGQSRLHRVVPAIDAHPSSELHAEAVFLAHGRGQRRRVRGVLLLQGLQLRLSRLVVLLRQPAQLVETCLVGRQKHD